LGVAALEPLRTLLGFNRSFEKTRILRRQCNDSYFRFLERRSRSLLIGCHRFGGDDSLSLKITECIQDFGMMRIDDVPPDPGGAGKRRDCGRRSRIVGETSKSIMQSRVCACSATRLWCGQVKLQRH